MFLEVTLKYPPMIHSLHRDFPLAPERYTVCYDELSALYKHTYKGMKNCKDIKSFEEDKLIPTFHDRKKYILHINCLIFYLNKGLNLSKVRRVVSFEQKAFLKDYILSLTQLRSSYAKRNLTFFVNMFKLLAN